MYADVTSILRHDKHMFLRRSLALLARAHISYMFVIFLSVHFGVLPPPPPPPSTKKLATLLPFGIKIMEFSLCRSPSKVHIMCSLLSKVKCAQSVDNSIPAQHSHWITYCMISAHFDIQAYMTLCFMNRCLHVFYKYTQSNQIGVCLSICQRQSKGNNICYNIIQRMCRQRRVAIWRLRDVYVVCFT